MNKKARRRRGQDLKLHAFQQRAHTIKRFHQRYCIDISDQEYNNLIMQIQTGKSLFVESKSTKVKDHLIQCRGKFFTVGYDKITKQIRTVLPALRF